jgi:hypothetical protein
MFHTSLGKSRHLNLVFLSTYQTTLLLANYAHESLSLELQAFQDQVKSQNLEQLFSKMLPSP